MTSKLNFFVLGFDACFCNLVHEVELFLPSMEGGGLLKNFSPSMGIEARIAS